MQVIWMIIHHASSIMACWQVVELRTPAKEGSDAFVSSYVSYDWWCTSESEYYWNGNEYSCESDYVELINVGNTLGKYYQTRTVSGLLPHSSPCSTAPSWLGRSSLVPGFRPTEPCLKALCRWWLGLGAVIHALPVLCICASPIRDCRFLQCDFYNITRVRLGLSHQKSTHSF